MRRYGALVLLLALAAVLVWQGGRLLGGLGDEEIARETRPPGEEPPLPGPEASAVPPPGGEPVLQGAPPARETVDVGGEETLAQAETEEDVAAAVALYTGATPEGWHEAPPAQRPHAIRPPTSRGPSISPGGRPGGFGPTGHWTRFPPPPPPKGEATLHVVVKDAAGTRVSGADLYLGPPEALHQPAVSFGDLRKIGRTTERGELLVPELPEGAAALAGNLENFLNGPRGLDMRSSIPVLLVARATVRAELTLPIELDAFGRVTGRVVDDEQRPVGRAEIRSGFFRTYADAEGQFEAPRLPAGPQSISARRTGYAVGNVEVEVPRGGSKHVEIVLRYRESGSLHLEGRVLDAGGGPVADASLYLIDETRRGTLRSTRSDAEGYYRFESLPDRLREAPCRVQVDKFRAGYPAAVVRFEEGIRDTRLDVRFPPRRVLARFHLVDASSGGPVTRCRIEPERLDDPEANVRGFLGSRADGVFEHWFDAGRYRFAVEAPEHVPQAVDVALTEPGTTVDVEVRMAPRGPEAVQVTLRVRVEDAVTAAPVTACRIAVLDAETREEVARFEGRSEDGTYSLPAPSGQRVLQVGAKDYEEAEQALTLPAEPPEAEAVVHLRPR